MECFITSLNFNLRSSPINYLTPFHLKVSSQIIKIYVKHFLYFFLLFHFTSDKLVVWKNFSFSYFFLNNFKWKYPTFFSIFIFLWENWNFPQIPEEHVYFSSFSSNKQGQPSSFTFSTFFSY